MEKLLTAGEVARLLNVSTAWVYDHADRKKPIIPSVRLQRMIFRIGSVVGDRNGGKLDRRRNKSKL